ncbi:MAG: panthothenate synthetase [Terriglobia bacterium]
MRILVRVTFPIEPFNTLVKNGSAGAKMKHILDELKPEAAYFTEFTGHRGGILIVNMESTSQIPAIAEPWFLTFNAQVEFHPVMLPEDLAKAGLDALGKKWA